MHRRNFLAAVAALPLGAAAIELRQPPAATQVSIDSPGGSIQGTEDLVAFVISVDRYVTYGQVAEGPIWELTEDMTFRKTSRHGHGVVATYGAIPPGGIAMVWGRECDS